MRGLTRSFPFSNAYCVESRVLQCYSPLVTIFSSNHKSWSDSRDPRKTFLSLSPRIYGKLQLSFHVRTMSVTISILMLSYFCCPACRQTVSGAHLIPSSYAGRNGTCYRWDRRWHAYGRTSQRTGTGRSRLENCGAKGYANPA
jgi:hypothetical protein